MAANLTSADAELLALAAFVFSEASAMNDGYENNSPAADRLEALLKERGVLKGASDG